MAAGGVEFIWITMTVFVAMLRNELRHYFVNSYFGTTQCFGSAANRQTMYYDSDTAPRHFNIRRLGHLLA